MLRTLSAAAFAVGFAGSPNAVTRPPTVSPAASIPLNIGLCETYDPKDSNDSALNPRNAIYAYLQSSQKSYLSELPPTEYSVQYLEKPLHGEIKLVYGEGVVRHIYVPTAGFVGADHYVAEVFVNEVKFVVSGYIRPSSAKASSRDTLCRSLGLPNATWETSIAEAFGNHVPDWLSDDPSASAVKKSGGWYNPPHQYKSNGKLGIPSLTISTEADWPLPIPKGIAFDPKARGTDYGTGVYLEVQGTKGNLYVGPSMINPARSACFILDTALNKQLGSWGPECKIAKMLASPQGRLIPRDPTAKRQGPQYRGGDYYYTPAGKNTRDTVRFILENGVGKQVEVFYNIKVANDSIQPD